jgi:hypothetical protein
MNKVKNCTLLGYYAACSGNSLQFFKTTCWYQFHASKILQLTGCPETSARNYHYMLCNSPEEHSSHLLRSRSLRSRKNKVLFRRTYLHYSCATSMCCLTRWTHRQLTRTVICYVYSHFNHKNN